MGGFVAFDNMHRLAKGAPRHGRRFLAESCNKVERRVVFGRVVFVVIWIDGTVVLQGGMSASAQRGELARWREVVLW